MSQFLEPLKLLLPVLTFGAGFVLNAWLERRKRRNIRSEAAIRDLVSALHEWHLVWSGLFLACSQARTSADIRDAIDNYNSKRTVARKVDFSLSILRSDVKTISLANNVCHAIYPGEIAERDRTISYSETREQMESQHLFQRIDANLTHDVLSTISALRLLLEARDLSDTRPGVDTDIDIALRDTKAHIASRFANFESMLSSIQRAAADAMTQI